MLAACGRWPAVVGVSLLCLLVGWVLGLDGLWAGGGTFVGGEPVDRRKGKGADEEASERVFGRWWWSRAVWFRAGMGGGWQNAATWFSLPDRHTRAGRIRLES